VGIPVAKALWEGHQPSRKSAFTAGGEAA